MRTYRLQGSVVLPVKLEDVFPFFAEPRNLQLLTPAWLTFEVLTPSPIQMLPGHSPVAQKEVTGPGFALAANRSSYAVTVLLQDEGAVAAGRALERAANASRSAAPLFRTGVWPARTHRIAATSHTDTALVLRRRPGFMESSLQAFLCGGMIRNNNVVKVSFSGRLVNEE